MKIKPPIQGSRWYKFMDPANKARIVEVEDLTYKPYEDSWIISVGPSIDGKVEWDLKDFVTAFRPL